MPTDQIQAAPASEAAHRASFFRQSGWLMIANIAAGLLMWGVHFLSKLISPAEYGIFGTLLAVAMCVPTMPMQMVLAQQTARSLATGRKAELVGTIRLIWLGTTLLSAVLAIGVFLFQKSILERWGMSSASGLWVTMAVVLLSLWMPMFWGVLQGRQNFLWLGWAMMLNGVARVAVAVLAVKAFQSGSTGMMAGALAGMLLSFGIALWQTRDLWSGPSLPSNKTELLGQIIPLMLGFAAFQFLFTADTMFVKSYFTGGETAFYVSAGTLSRALMWAVGPLASVMFPRLVHSAAKGEKSNLMGMVLLGTALLAVLGAAGLSIVGPWVVKFVYGEAYVQVAASVLPWYAGAMVPLALANVLLNNLLAQSRFKVVLWLVILAVGYAFALNAVLARYHDLIRVLQTLGLCNLVLLAVCAWFSRAGSTTAERKSAAV